MKNPKDEDEEDIIKKTMENTLTNKYVGMIENQKENKEEK